MTLLLPSIIVVQVYYIHVRVMMGITLVHDSYKKKVDLQYLHKDDFLNKIHIKRKTIESTRTKLSHKSTSTMAYQTYKKNHYIHILKNFMYIKI